MTKNTALLKKTKEKYDGFDPFGVTKRFLLILLFVYVFTEARAQLEKAREELVWMDMCCCSLSKATDAIWCDQRRTQPRSNRKTLRSRAVLMNCR